MTRADKISAIRFILTMPLDQPYHVSSLPDYVFTYIYEVGHTQDIPWLTFIEDETGQNISKHNISDDPYTVGSWCMDSPLLSISMDLDEVIRALYHEQIGLRQFELTLLAIFKTYKSKFI